MAETISRSLRDGALGGEYAPALNLADSLRAPFGSHAFNHFLSVLVSNIAAAKSQARGVVLVAYTRSPSFYLALLRSRGVEASKLNQWVKILDCYSDPLGWKYGIRQTLKVDVSSVKDSGTVSKDVRDTDKVLSSVIDLGRGFLGQGKERFAVAIDSGGPSSCNGFIEPNGGNRTMYQEGAGFKSGWQHCFQISPSVQHALVEMSHGVKKIPLLPFCDQERPSGCFIESNGVNKPHAGKVFVLRADANTSSRCPRVHNQTPRADSSATSGSLLRSILKIKDKKI